MATLNDVVYNKLGTLGYTGTLNERMMQFFSDYTPAGSVTWDTLEGKPSTFPPTIGTTATTAKAGNYQPTWSQVTSKPILMTQATAAPATPTDPGTAGQFFITSDALFICVATDTWRQATLTEWTP